MSYMYAAITKNDETFPLCLVDYSSKWVLSRALMLSSVHFYPKSHWQFHALLVLPCSIDTQLQLVFEMCFGQNSLFSLIWAQDQKRKMDRQAAKFPKRPRLLTDRNLYASTSSLCFRRLENLDVNAGGGNNRWAINWYYKIYIVLIFLGNSLFCRRNAANTEDHSTEADKENTADESDLLPWWNTGEFVSIHYLLWFINAIEQQSQWRSADEHSKSSKWPHYSQVRLIAIIHYWLYSILNS